MRLDKTVKFSINTMATNEAALQIRDELIKRQVTEQPSARTIVLDLRDWLSEDKLQSAVETLKCLNDIKGVDLTSIGRINYSRVNPTLDTCKEENLYRRDPQAEPPTRFPFHVTVALACPGALERRRREGRVQH